MDKRKTVAFVIASLAGGGAEKVLLHVLEKLDRGKFRLKLFVRIKEGIYLNRVPPDVHVEYGVEMPSLLADPKAPKWVKLLRFPLKRATFNALNLLVWPRFRRFSEDADVVVGFLEQDSTYLAAKAGKKLNKRTVGWIHIDLIQHLDDKNKRKSGECYAGLDKVIACSDKAGKSAVRLYPFLSAKLETIYNPIDVEGVRSMALEPVEGYEFEGIHVIAAGRLEKQKGFEFLIRTHKKLLDSGLRHRLVILGEGSERESLSKLARQLGVEDTLLMPGFVDNPYNWIACSDVFALSSRYEGLCNILIESMAVGTPVVSANCPGGPSEILKDGEYGLLTEVGDADGMALAIRRLLADEPLRTKLRETGKTRADSFSAELVIPRIEQAIDEL